MSKVIHEADALNQVKFTSDGAADGSNPLLPVVVQDVTTGEVLMQAYANREALERTLATRQATYYSRSRQELWVKGQTSGHTQQVQELWVDCDGDSLLYRVVQTGPACHTGEVSCFYRPLLTADTPPEPKLGEVLERVYGTITDRLRTLPEGSYVARLHAGGLDRVLKKITEEAGEVLLAAKNNDPAELATETADLLFHTFFALAEVGVTPADISRVLSEREGKTGLKGPKEVG